MLKPPGKKFAKVSVASTLCPACSERVVHRTNFTVVAVQNDIAEGTRTKLVANDTLVIHVCRTSHNETRESSTP
jgi:hypothetical protein